MEKAVQNGQVIRFATFEVDLRSGELRKAGLKLKLTGQPFQILVILLERPGEVVTRDELQKRLWPDTFVDVDHNLNSAINKIREVLDDAAENPRFVETLPRRGYRFIGLPPQSEKDPISDVADPQRPSAVTRSIPWFARKRWMVVVAAMTFVALLFAGYMWRRSFLHVPDHSEWVALTKLSDSVSQPALSPDGRMLAFIRGPYTFFGPGQVYVKMLPDGQPVQLTHDGYDKMSPAFSPDGARIAYTTVDSDFAWDTWIVPTLGGEPQPWLRNASGLVWSSQHQVLFSKMGTTPHMGIAVAEESRLGERDVYDPATEPGMAHRSYLSPDGKWVLLVEMNQDHMWVPCRLVPMDGASRGHEVGPSGAACTSAAWSRDGEWMYFTADVGGVNHIWRQRFPSGAVQQMTSGPTEEEGIAMAPDGRSFVTAVAVQNVSVWLHDRAGERQVSLEGNAAEAKFSPDGKKLCYRIVAKAPNFFQFGKSPGEVWVADLESRRSTPLASGFPALAYDVSADGQHVVLEAEDRAGKPRLWMTSFDRSSAPQQVPNVEGRQPRFGPGSEIFFRGNDGFAYRVLPDGSELRRALDLPILRLFAISPDGRWLVGWARLPGNSWAAIYAHPLNGGPLVRLGERVNWQWSAGGELVSLAELPFGEDGISYFVALPTSGVLPHIPPKGFRSEDELARLPGARRINALMAVPGPSPDVYAFSRSRTQRNLYRIPIP